LVNEKLKNAIEERDNSVTNKLSRLNEINKKIEKLEERLMNDALEASTYKNLFKKFSAERALLLKEIETLKKNKDDRWKRLEKLLSELTDLNALYEKIKPVSAKISMIKGGQT